MEPAPTPPHRKRMRRLEIPGDVRFVTFSCNHRLPLLRNPAIAAICREAIASARARYNYQLFAWVIMPDHVHLLVRPDEGAPVSRALLAIKLSVSQQVLPRWRELEAPVLDRIMHKDGKARFWLKGGGFDHNVRNEASFRKFVRYIHRNPMKRGLVEEPSQWRFSSLRWWIGVRDGELPCDPPPGDPRYWEDWRGYQ